VSSSSVPSANLLQLCRIESPFNQTNREEEGSKAEPEERNKREGNTVWPTGELLESRPTKEERLLNLQELIT